MGCEPLAGLDHQLPAADSEAQRTASHIAELFALVLVLRHHAAGLHGDESKSDPFAREKAACKKIGELFFRDFF